MKRIAFVTPALLLLACGEASEPATANPSDATTTPSAGSNTVTEASGEGGATLIASVREAAVQAPKVDRMKLRFDASGGLVKQAVYHDDRSAMPEAVLALVETTFPGATARHYETEHYAELGAVFEVEVETAEGQRCELAAQEDGTGLYKECHIDAAELPPAIGDAIAGKTVLEVEHKTHEDGSAEYTVEVEEGGREYYLHFDGAGALQSKHLRVPAIVELPVE